MSEVAVDTRVHHEELGDTGGSSSSALLEAFDEYISEPEATTMLGDAVAEIAAAFSFTQNEDGYSAAAPTDSEAGLSNYKLFQVYGQLVDALLSQFAESSDHVQKELLDAIEMEWKSCGGASPYMAIGYVNAALDFDAFTLLVQEQISVENFVMCSTEEGPNEE